jgi:DNA-binding PadR family transcriptional regulator
MRSPVYWTLLGLVIDRPGLYGYQLLKRFEWEYGAMLPIKSDSHIYEALDVLLGRGLIEATPGKEFVESGGERQPKPVYRAIGAGMLAYQEWLRTQVVKDRRQAAMFARQLAVLAHHPTVALEIIACLEQASLEEARHAKAGPAGGTHSDEWSGLADELESQESRLVLDSKLEFANYARSRFEALRRREACGDGRAAGA